MGYFSTLFALQSHGALQRGRERARRSVGWARLWHPTQTWIPATLSAAVLAWPVMAVAGSTAGVIAWSCLAPALLVLLVCNPTRR